MTQPDKDNEIELFLQGEGILEITLVRVPRRGTVRDILAVAATHDLTVGGDEPFVMLEDAEEPLQPDTTLQQAGVTHRSRVHVHRCRRVSVTVNYNGNPKTETFPPSATVARVKKWAVGKHGFNPAGIDATEHLLQLCGSADRPDEDIHIGSLVTSPACSVCFDLVPKKRVEG